jgi:hypothetical protein
MFSGKMDGIDDVSHTRTASNERGTPVYQAVPNVPGGFVARIARGEYRTLQAFPEVLNVRFVYYSLSAGLGNVHNSRIKSGSIAG